MDSTPNQPDPREARETLNAIQQTSERGAQRGLYSRTYAIGLALWGGAIAATIETVAWPIVFIAGCVAHYYYKKRKGAWIREIQTRRDLWIVAGLSAVTGAAIVGGYIGLKYYALAWAPVAAGILVFTLIFTTTELSYRAQWANGEGGAQ